MLSRPSPETHAGPITDGNTELATVLSPAYSPESADKQFHTAKALSACRGRETACLFSSQLKEETSNLREEC